MQVDLLLKIFYLLILADLGGFKLHPLLAILPTHVR